MSVKIVVDMNLPAEWVSELTRQGWHAVHWSKVGDPRADDATVMAWALANAHTVFTHDLDFGTLLALTHASGPSVLQVRGENTMPEDIKSYVFAALRQYEGLLTSGAIVVVDERKSRVRVLPF